MLFLLRNAGERLACGVIGIRRPVDRLPTPQSNTISSRPMSFVPTFWQQPQAMRTMQ